jgi:hypothetical protein
LALGNNGLSPRSLVCALPGTCQNPQRTQLITLTRL